MELSLTQEQQEVLNTFQDTLVIAGPGTGKTYTLVAKVKHLIEKDYVSPEKILVLTYSLKTSKELKQRLIKHGLKHVKVDTFHGYAYDLWCQHHQKPPKLITEQEKKEILKKLFGKTKNPLKLPNHKLSFFEYLKKNQLLDFELLLYEALSLSNINFAGYHVIIDEFQDLSEDILKFLTLFNDATFTLFGDPNQSIYGFRGANLKNLKAFWENFRPNLKILALSQSFRCPEEILKHAENFKSSPWAKITYTSVKKGGKVEGMFFEKTFQEKEVLTDLVKKLLGGLQLEQQTQEGLPPKEIFVLARLKEVFQPLKETFIKAGIPVNLVEEEAKTAYETLQEFISEVQTSAFSVEDLIKKAHPKIKTYSENLWELSDQNKERFLGYLLSTHYSDLIEIDQEGVNFLSIHASKGLEAEVVILVGVEQGLIPLTLFQDTDEEEEKRLIYVAITRTKREFYFSAVKERKVYQFCLNSGLSPLFKGMPLKTFKPKPPKPKQSSLFSL
ncbi:ATP-dependent helicase [Thermodesulfobacterium sp. TA1]|uniref:UvrD-helicase domain-containing protein n=1 Tax=Thermodesulfobacterium sp. TA1 TaxID=2234087 RepID=UPI0012321A83|nr:ATP-dependent helicase [Thermodesulfobacterium sp. TA1]QER42188.1 ATP-dependent helicase [Thermodesulfobacterium sp. TA1]